MFEEMTYDYLMAQMMADMPDGLDTSEGSLLYHACAKQAVRLEEAYQQLASIEKNLFLDTADIDHLIELGKDRGVYINYATFAEFRAQFNLSVEAGARFNAGDYNYTVLDAEDEEAHIYQVVCDSPGKEPNNLLLDLTPIEYIDGFSWGKLLECTKPGSDMEDTENYRARLRLSIFNQGSGGNRAYYLNRLKSHKGVGGTKLTRVTSPQDYITATIITNDYGKPSEDLLEELQTYVDPVVNSGEGYGIAPIGHRVTIVAVEETQINIDADITFETGITYEDVGVQVENEIEEYLLSLRKKWEESESLAVRIVQIEAALIEIPGIVDVAGTKINGAESNLILGGTIPVKGDITCVRR